MSNEFIISSGGSYDTLQAAVDAAHSSDTIFVEAGLYENETAVIDKDLEIVGVNGAAHFRSSGLIDNRKGILVVEGDYDLSVGNLILEGARVGDRNGAGIRFQGESLKVDNVKFIDNEMGILAGKSSDPSKARTLDVTNSVFEDNGGVNGSVGHGIYALHLGHAKITDSHISGTVTGHHIKSRAYETTIEGNRLLDDNSNTSYNIDLPNQGHAVIRNNYIEQSSQSPNLKLINYGGETSGGGLAAKPGSLLVENNAFINYANKGTAVANRTSIDAELIDNAYYNISTRLSGDGSETGGRVLQQPQQVLAVDDEPVTSAEDAVTNNVVGNDVTNDLGNDLGNDVGNDVQAPQDTGGGSPDNGPFAESGFSSYSSGQDMSGGVAVLEGGRQVGLNGNSWKKVGFDYDVTPDTVLSFDFRAEGLAELHAIGIDTDNDWRTGPLPFALAGSQESPFENSYLDYGGSDWQSFAIRLGEHWTGSMSYLTFIHDDDNGSADAVSQFRNIALYEPGAAQDIALTGQTSPEDAPLL